MTANIYERIKYEIDFLDYARRVLPPDTATEPCGAGTTRLKPCPFCGSEKGCTVYEKSFSCFACEKGGDLTKFVALIKNISNGDAAKQIAEDCGLNGNGGSDYTPAKRPPKKKGIERVPGIDSDEAYQIRAWAASVYQANFLHDEAAIKYQTGERGHVYATLVDEKIGLGKRNLLAQADAAGFTPMQLEAVGLVKTGKNGYFETIPAGMYVYPHIIGRRTAYFTLKDPAKSKNFQIQKKFSTPDWMCWGQDALDRQTVIIVEGENDRLAVIDAGYKNVIATIGNFNSTGILEAISKIAKDKFFFLCFDNDDAGRKYAEKYRAAIRKGGGKAHIINLPEGVKDIDDVLRAADNPRQALGTLMKAAELDTEADDDGNKSGNNDNKSPFRFESFEVLGELADGQLVFWAKEKKCIYARNLKDLNLDQLIQIGGREVNERVCRTIKEVEEAGDAGENKMLFNVVKRYLIVEAGDNRMPKLEKIGQGIHDLKNGRIIIVNGGEAIIWDGTEFTGQAHPLIKNRMLIQFSPGEEWISTGELKKRVRAMTPEQGRQITEALYQQFNQWGFRGSLDARLLTGWFLGQMVQAIWEWRPHIWMAGAAESGKTKMNQLIECLLGDIMLPCQGSKLTEPGLRQAINDNATLVYIDEFEKTRDRENIIALLRMAGRSGVGRIGSAGGKGVEFSLKHMVFVSSIEKGLTRSAETTRFLNIDTVKDPTRKPMLPGHAQARELRMDAFAYAVWVSLKARAIIKEAERDLNRFEESLAVPFVMFAAVSDNPNKVAALRVHLTEYQAEWDRLNSGVMLEDEELLMAEILGAKLRLQKRQQDLDGQHERLVTVDYTVSQSIFGEEAGPNFDDWKAIIESNGIRPVADEDAIYFYPANVSRYLLKGTQWEGMQIKDILLRIPGSEWKKKRIAGSHPFCVSIPATWFKAKGFSEC